MADAWTRYRRILIVLAPCVLGTIAALNALLDPYGAYRLVPLAPLAPYREAFESRIARAEILAHAPCELVILGTSRAQVALDPRHPAWGLPGCNLSVTGAGIGEVEAVLRRVLERRPPVLEIVWTLDFLSFRAGGPTHPEFARSRFNPDLEPLEYHAGLLLGSAASRASWHVLRDYWKDERSPFGPLGMTDPGLSKRRSRYYERFVWALERDVQSLASRNAIVYDPSTVSDVFALAERARARGLRVTLLILPSHVLHYESLDRFGQWESFEQWRADLLAEQADHEDIPVLDCTHYSGPGAEDVPDPDVSTEMRWHWDSVHIKRSLGDAIIEELRSPADPDRARLCPALTPESLPGALARIREERAAYRAAHATQLTLLDAAEARAFAP